MRILHLVSYPIYSGPLPPTLGLARAQRALGHEAWVAFETKRANLNAYEEPAAPHVRGSVLEAPIALTLSAKSTPLELWRDTRALRRFMREGGLDVLHLHMSHDHTLAAAAGNARGRVRRVRTIHSARSLAPRLGQRWLHAKCDAWIVRSEAHRALLTSRFALTATSTAVIPGGVDAEVFVPASAAARAAARRRFELPADVIVLGHVALMAGRGQEELLAAVRALDDARLHLVFVGRGEHEASLRELADAMGLGARARFLGYLQGAELLAAYAAMDAAFVAQAGNDASARAALEALACERPVIAVGEDALAELVTEAVGFPVVSRRPEHLVGGLRAWLTAPDLGAARARAGRALVVSERSYAREAERTVALY